MSKRRRLVHIVTVGLPHGGSNNVAVASSYEKAEKLVYKVEDELGINCDDIDIETWELNTIEENQDDL